VKNGIESAYLATVPCMNNLFPCRLAISCLIEAFFGPEGMPEKVWEDEKCSDGMYGRPSKQVIAGNFVNRGCRHEM
jgi:hypothetical protein